MFLFIYSIVSLFLSKVVFVCTTFYRFYFCFVCIYVIFQTVHLYMYEQKKKTSLTFSWRRSLSCKNQSIDLLYNSLGWFLYDRTSVMKELILQTVQNFVINLILSCIMLKNGQTYLKNIAMFTATFFNYVHERIKKSSFNSTFLRQLPIS